MDNMPGLRIRLFGRFSALRNGQVMAGLNARKVQELFCYLLLYRQRPHPRETLADLLWSSAARSAKKYLRQALWQLQSTLEDDSRASGDRVLLIEADWIQINPDAELWLDVAELERAFSLVEGCPGSRLEAQKVRQLHAAADLYTGDLLEACYHDWCLFERERLQNLYLALLDKLMDYCESHREYEAGLGYGMRILRIDRARERTHRRRMRLYWMAGDRTAALRQYERCRAALEEELGVEPAAVTTALCRQIRSGRFGGPEADAGAGSQDSTEVIRGLERLQCALQQLLGQVQHEIRTMERLRRGPG